MEIGWVRMDIMGSLYSERLIDLAQHMHIPVEKLKSACNVILHVSTSRGVKIFDPICKDTYIRYTQYRRYIAIFCAFPGVDFSTGCIWHICCSIKEYDPFNTAWLDDIATSIL